MLDIKLKKRATYLVPANFGLSSMVLLDMALKEGIKVVVACIKYNGSAQEDVDGLSTYCQEHNIPFRFFDASNLFPNEGEPFAQFARRVRYGFFEQVYREIKPHAMLLSHCQDDLLETYIYQRNHDRSRAKYGMSASTIVDGMIVIRPLLSLSRPDLEDYAEENNVIYSKQATDYEESHTEDEVFQKVRSLSEIDRENLLEEMRYANDEKIKLQKEFAERIDEGEELDIRALIALSKDGFTTALLHFVARSDDQIDLDSETIAKIREFCLSPVPNDSFHLAGNTYLTKEYDILTLGTRYDELPYTYVMEKPSKIDTPNFEIDFSMGAEDRGIKEEDYPITIRSALPYDTYVVHDYLESVLRLYSEWKMPVRLRHIWPIFLNKNGKIIYVPRYRNGFTEEHTSVLRMKLKDDER